MSVDFEHRHDHAVVNFSGPITWDSAHDLVGAITAIVDHYFYTEVELVVSSAGGNLGALGHYLDALQAWRRRGVRVRTRVVSLAASAAAIMVCVGDERIAEPRACLVFHQSMARPEGTISASDTQELHTALRRMDRRLISLMVERALETTARVPARAERSDRRVLETLAAGLSTGEAPRKVSALARLLGDLVERAVESKDRKTLSRLYGRLAEIDVPISAPLARTLRLIDRIGDAPRERSVKSGESGLLIPQWRALYPPAGEVPREVLARHTLILGETGSGKTASAILPVVAAMARAPRDRLAAALIIDPKRELLSTLARLAPQRLHHVTAQTSVLDVMQGPRWRLDEDLAAERWMSAATRILFRIASFLPSSPARVLGAHGASKSSDEFFEREGSELLLSVLSVVLMVTSRDAPPPGEWLDHDAEARTWVERLIERARRAAGPNIIALAAWLLDSPVLTFPHTDNDDPPAPQDAWLLARIATAARWLWGSEPGEARDVLDRIVGYWAPTASIDRQYAGVRSTARTVCMDFSSPAIAHSLYFGCEPGYRSRPPEVDFLGAVSRHGAGRLMLFQPSRDQLDDLVAIALKACFFEAVLDDLDRATGASDLPLVGYVSDEFHRFVTSDRVHGEQSFLDTCRSFGAFCVLATQSVASLEHALAQGGGSQRQDETAIEILWNNSGNKIVFRTTDPKTSSRLQELCPHRPGLAGVARVRPVSTLTSGECYAVLADGRFERRQLDPYVEASPERAVHREPQGRGERS